MISRLSVRLLKGSFDKGTRGKSKESSKKKKVKISEKKNFKLPNLRNSEGTDSDQSDIYDRNCEKENSSILLATPLLLDVFDSVLHSPPKPDKEPATCAKEDPEETNFSPRMPQLSLEVNTFEEIESGWLEDCYFTPDINMPVRSKSSVSTDEDSHIPPIKFRKTMGRYQLVKPEIAGMASSPEEEVDQDMKMASPPPKMPVLEPEISRPNTRSRKQLTSTLAPKDADASTPPPKVPQADPEKDNSSKMLPVGAQISLRAYYYGRWNYQEEEAIKPKSTKVAAGKINRKRKSIFDTEFTKYNASSILETPVDCNLCPEKIARNNDILVHAMEHIKAGDPEAEQWKIVPLQESPKLESLKNQCRICLTKCKSLRVHMREVHQHVTDICCRICEIALDSVELMKLHHAKFHRVAEMPYCCPTCDCRTSLRWDMIRHFQNHHGHQGSVLCTFCMKLLPANSADGMKVLQEHLLLHKSEPELNCVRCSLKFVEKGDLTYHMNNHHDEQSYMQGDQFRDSLKGYQCFKEEGARKPMFIDRPKVNK